MEPVLQWFAVIVDAVVVVSAETEIALPDVTASSVRLSQGKLSGMANWTRWGDAKLETK